LIFGLVEKFAFRAYGRACDERYIVASLGKQLAGYQRIFLRPTKYQSRNDVNDFHRKIKYREQRSLRHYKSSG
jgi:hypothetical protein